MEQKSTLLNPSSKTTKHTSTKQEPSKSNFALKTIIILFVIVAFIAIVLGVSLGKKK